MMSKEIRIVALRCFPGASAGLCQKTALVTLQLDGDTAAWHHGTFLTHARLVSLLPEVAMSLPGMVSDTDMAAWPQSFLHQGVVGNLFASTVAALTVAIQREARDPVWRGRVLGQDGNTFHLALPYEREAVLKDALPWVLRHLLLWSNPDLQQSPHSTALGQAYRSWLQTVRHGGLSPNTLRFALAAHKRGIPVLAESGLLWLGWGIVTQRLDSSFTGNSSQIAARIARDKHLTSRLLHQAGLPVPPTGKAANWDGALAFAKRLGWPVVVKPGNQDQGKAVVPGICDEATLLAAFDEAEKYSPGGVIVEKHIQGEDHRLLVVGGRLLMATKRIPAGVVGDGQSSVTALVEQINLDWRRGSDNRSLLMQIDLDDEALFCLSEIGLNPNTVLELGRFVRLRRTANISRGGSAVDVSGSIHPDNRWLAERAARVIGLDIAGVDFLCPDISRSWREVGGGICEVNAQPGFRPHWLGDPARDINGEILDWMFKAKPVRIPTVAITGTNGKSTTARMLHHIWMTAGKVAGVCTTQGVWVGNDLVTSDNLSGYPGGRMLLADPALDVAVIEMPRKGLIRFGHPCDRYDVGALLNVQDDHIGVNGIDSLEAMALLKAEVLERASQAVVVNADDSLCLAMLAKTGAHRHFLVARDGGNPAIKSHRAKGGQAVFIQTNESNPYVVLATGDTEMQLMRLFDIPATMNGLLRFNEMNALFATALAWAQGLSPVTIRSALSSFHNSPEQNPGRYNFIEGLPFRVLVDYGHNPEGMRGLMDVVDRVAVSGRRVLVNTNGLRFRHHLAQELPGYAKTFDRIYLGHYEDYFQRFAQGFGSDDPLSEMFRQAQDILMPMLGSDQRLYIIRNHLEAIRAGLEGCQPGDLLVILAEPTDALQLIETFRERLVCDAHEF